MPVRRERKYALDSNVFIDAFRNVDRAAELEAFHAAFTPFEYLSAVVAMELRAGAGRGDAAEKLERYVLEPFERRGRVITPGYAAWKQAGEALATLRDQNGAVPSGRRWQAFANDVLLAISCRDAGVVVVTSNNRDFERIASVTGCGFVAPWPSPR